MIYQYSSIVDKDASTIDSIERQLVQDIVAGSLFPYNPIEEWIDSIREILDNLI